MPIERFDRDDDACRAIGNDYTSYDARGMSGTQYARNRVFNQLYGDCGTSAVIATPFTSASEKSAAAIAPLALAAPADLLRRASRSLVPGILNGLI